MENAGVHSEIHPGCCFSAACCCDSQKVTRGQKALCVWRHDSPVGGCFGGLHLACDCFAVRCDFFSFYAASRLVASAVHVTDDFFFLW
jgi:hypothetical protein